MKNLLLTISLFVGTVVSNFAYGQSSEPEELKVSSTTTQPVAAKKETGSNAQLNAQRARLAAERNRSGVNGNEGKANAVKQQVAPKPTVQVKKAADADARAMERKQAAKKVGPGNVSNSTSTKHL